ncbi:MAG: tetratricopeptide repeat protein, partial [Bacteroidota bacterium]
MKKVNKNLVHLSIAERGRAYRTAGNHDKALRCYREALRLAEQQQASDIFFQYYTQCIMESLELSGAYAEVIA